MEKTKRSLILSALSFLFCVVLLISTTFAWFTDSLNSGKNKILAGNLDVTLVHTNNKVTTPTAVKDATDLFPVTKWEPGVMAYENLTVSNAGTLAMKFTLSLKVFEKNTYNTHALSEVIKVAVVPGGFTGDRAAAEKLTFTSLQDAQTVLSETLVSGSSAQPVGIVLYWERTDHDNDYNVNNGTTADDGEAKLFLTLGVDLVATQLNEN